MIGGGKDAFIGAIHRVALNMDGLIELSCGALSINPQIAEDSGRSLFLPQDRIYMTYEEMLQKESQLPEDKRIDFVTIVTPNFAHFAPAMMALDKGFHVVIEKPMTFTLDEAKQLRQKVADTGLLLCLTHTYSGYPMVKQARAMVQGGELGKVRKIYVEYPQGWLSKLTEREGNAQAAWRTDPKKSGKAGNAEAVFHRLDVNRDNKLSAAEARQDSKVLGAWRRLDAKRKGTITRAEFMAKYKAVVD